MVSLDYAYRRLVNTLCPDFVALPQTTEEVAALVNLSDESQLQITPRGGGTSWYGGTVPNRGGVLVDMRKMNAILGLDADARTVTVEAGATWKDIEDYVESKGFALTVRSEEHTSELQSRPHLVCSLLLEKKKKLKIQHITSAKKNKQI